jgi:DNA-binding response OmpR family regulator
MNSRQLLITVDDDAQIRAFVRSIAVRLGFDVTEVGDPDLLMDVVARTVPYVIVLDLNMPGTDGIALMRRLQAEKCQAKLILLSGCDSRTLQTVQQLAHTYALNLLGTVQKPPTVAAIEGLLKAA